MVLITLIIVLNFGVLGKEEGARADGDVSPVAVLPPVFGYSTQCGALPDLRSVANAEVVVGQRGD